MSDFPYKMTDLSLKNPYCRVVPRDCPGRLLVRKLPKVEQTAGGLALPTESQKNPVCVAFVVKPDEEAATGGFREGHAIAAPNHIFSAKLENDAFGPDLYYINSDEAVLHWADPDCEVK